MAMRTADESARSPRQGEMGRTRSDRRDHRDTKRHPLPGVQASRRDTFGSVDLVETVGEQGRNEVRQDKHELPNRGDHRLFLRQEPLDGDFEKVVSFGIIMVTRPHSLATRHGLKLDSKNPSRTRRTKTGATLSEKVIPNKSYKPMRISVTWM